MVCRTVTMTTVVNKDQRQRLEVSSYNITIAKQVNKHIHQKVVKQGT